MEDLRGWVLDWKSWMDMYKQAVGGTVGLAVGVGLTGDPSPE
jgi:hypothetical protein